MVGQWKTLALLGAIFLPAQGFGNSTLEFAYTADYLNNVRGGLREGDAYLQNFDLVLDIDQLGSGDGVLHVHLLWNDASTFSDLYPGDLQIVSNIDAERAARIFEFWYERGLTENSSLRFGLYDLNSEFDAIETAGFFTNSSHGIGAEFAQTGDNGPSIFPVTSLAARLNWQIGERSELRYAMLDGVPGDPDDPTATAIQFNDGEGVLHALEFNRMTGSGWRLGLGAWSYTADFDVIGTQEERDNDNRGLYGFAEIARSSGPNARRETGLFIRYGVANEDLNVLGSYVGLGLVMSGFSSRRPGDQVGLSLAHARSGSPYRSSVVAGGGKADTHESIIELAYRAPINDFLTLQPNIQYVVNPSLDPGLDNALVLGLRIELSHSR